MPLPLAAVAANKLNKAGRRAVEVIDNDQGLTLRQRARLKTLPQQSTAGLTQSQRAELARLRQKDLARA